MCTFVFICVHTVQYAWSCAMLFSVFCIQQMLASACDSLFFNACHGRKAPNLSQLQLPIKASMWACKNLLICLGSDDYFVRAEWLTISLHTELDCVLRSDS